MARCVGYIYEENDYTVFKKLKDNRKVTKGRVDKLVQSLSEKEIMNPIVVNDKMEIIDGQGRFEAKKRLGTPIRYVIEPNADIEDCRRMNRFNSKWCFDDYVESYAEEGNENYNDEEGGMMGELFAGEEGNRGEGLAWGAVSLAGEVNEGTWLKGKDAEFQFRAAGGQAP